jgi:hypothetical protein
MSGVFPRLKAGLKNREFPAVPVEQRFAIIQTPCIESKSGDRCFVVFPKSQLETLNNSKERKVRTPKGSEPANGGAFEGISSSNFKFEISEENPRTTTSATENRPADALQILRSGI